MSNALVILAECFEEIEAVCVIDILRRAEVDCIVAAQHEPKFVTGKTGIQIVADELLDDLTEQIFDLIVLPGGPGVRHLRKDPRILDLVKRQNEAKRTVGAICAAPTVLHEAGLLQGHRFTCHPTVAQELKNPEPDAVVADGNIVTSRGAGTAVEFSLALVEQLCGAAKAAEIREAICCP
jgi:protein deglycase